MTDQLIHDLWRKVQIHMGENDTAAARAVLETLLQQQPRHAAAHMTLSHIAWADDRVRDAARHALDAACDLPSEAMSIMAVAMALIRVGEIVTARICLEHPALKGADVGSVLVYHATLRRQLGDDNEALTLLDRAHALGMDGSEFRFIRGMESMICGHLSQAESDFETSLRMDPSAGAAALELARLCKRTAACNHLDDFDRRVRKVAPGTQDHAALEFARYKELEDLGRYEHAWQALQHANAIMRALHPCDLGHTRQQVDGLVRNCTSQFLRVENEEATGEGAQPIFIFGLPRSGTTLLDRLLGSHSQVTSAGELEDFTRQLCWAADQRAVLDASMLKILSDLDYREIGERYLMQTQWRAPGARFFIDKQPWNHTVAGLIRRALPQARMLHVIRDPMDVCFSNYRAMLGERYAYSFDLDATAEHYAQYRRLHAYWMKAMPGRILDVSYRDMVSNTEATMRAVLAFCGLDWERACVDPSRNKTAIGTLSAVQARSSIHSRAFGEWRRYEKQLSRLREALASSGFASVGATLS